MRRPKDKIFAQLEDRKRALAKNQVHLLPKNQKSLTALKSITIGEWALRLRMRPATVIGIFERAGVHGLSPSHVLDPSHTEALLTFINAEKITHTAEVYSDSGLSAPKIVVVQAINAQLLEQLARTPKLMYHLEPRRFEELVARLLEDQGCQVTLTKRTRDGGYDIFGRMNTGPTEVVFLAECKRYSPENKVGVELVRNLYGVTEIHKANLGLLITSSSFSADAEQEKIRIGPRISLKDYDDLKSWLSRYKSPSL